jgi:hypothetical protein
MGHDIPRVDVEADMIQRVDSFVPHLKMTANVMQ